MINLAEIFKLAHTAYTLTIGTLIGGQTAFVETLKQHEKQLGQEHKNDTLKTLKNELQKSIEGLTIHERRYQITQFLVIAIDIALANEDTDYDSLFNTLNTHSKASKDYEESRSWLNRYPQYEAHVSSLTQSMRESLQELINIKKEKIETENRKQKEFEDKEAALAHASQCIDAYMNTIKNPDKKDEKLTEENVATLIALMQTLATAKNELTEAKNQLGIGLIQENEGISNTSSSTNLSADGSDTSPKKNLSKSNLETLKNENKKLKQELEDIKISFKFTPEQFQSAINSLPINANLNVIVGLPESDNNISRSNSELKGDTGTSERSDEDISGESTADNEEEKSFRESNALLQQALDDIKKQQALKKQEPFNLTLKQFKALKKSSLLDSGLNKLAGLIEIIVKMNLAYKAFLDKELATAQNENFQVAYYYFIKRLRCLTNAEIQKEHLINVSTLAHTKTDSELCNFIKTHLGDITEDTSKKSIDFSLIQNKTAPVVQSAEEEVKNKKGAKQSIFSLFGGGAKKISSPDLATLSTSRESYDQAHIKVSKKMGIEAGVGNEFYKFATQISNGNFDKILSEWGPFILENINALIALECQLNKINPLAYNAVSEHLEVFTLFRNFSLKYKACSGTGHCLFQAVSASLNKDPKILREELIQYISLEANQQEFSDFPQLFGESINHFMRSIQAGEECQSQVELEILSRFFKQRIIVIDFDKKIKNPEVIEKYPDKPPIFIYSNNQSHYDGLSFVKNLGTDSENTTEIELLHHLMQFNQHLQPNEIIPSEQTERASSPTFGSSS
ncbi:MAG: hypothetical protein JSS53_02865 [Proteobacteria bacterium]|nr:hypothetical protein [Pseudomonadota bacterium]